MSDAGEAAVAELRQWLLDLIVEFNVTAVFMSGRGQDEQEQPPAVDEQQLKNDAAAFDGLLKEFGFVPCADVETTENRIAQFRCVVVQCGWVFFLELWEEVCLGLEAVSVAVLCSGWLR